jgi:DNA polymerase III delta prime subunit
MRKLVFLLLIFVLSILACGGSGSSTRATSPPRETVTVKSGELRNTIRSYSGTITRNTVFKVQKLDGTYDNRSNDLRELCLDFNYYRDQIIEHTAKGNIAKADDARDWLDRINLWLDAYNEDDIQAMFTLIKDKGW